MNVSSVLVAAKRFFLSPRFGFDDILFAPAVKRIVFPLYLYLADAFVWGFLPIAVCPKPSFELMLQQIRTLA